MTYAKPARRAVLLGGLAGLGATLLGCATSESSQPPSASASKPRPKRTPELSTLESENGRRIGVYARHTGTGETVAHRADERFLMCSTAKLLAASAILKQHEQQPDLLDKVIHYDREVLMPYSEITEQHVDKGMTVAELAAASITHSDNAAMNLLLDELGGPSVVTDFVRDLGDEVTRLDRIEPHLNVSAPGDERDTTTPERIGSDLRALALGDALAEQGRARLVRWLRGNTTGDKSIKAGLPRDWQVGDKTGSGNNGEVNDVAVAWPPDGDPLIIAVYTAPDGAERDNGYETVAAAAKIAAEALTSS
ncbi:beta-lactamase class A [Tamaricihabitans halophyticus]|uniref:Beta-lactamase n=1 Tax=Tamaricihabitans halophyticus TaxID=1262583 RepID=A0A4R2R275_9PSEU|nr:class A beta-lactamase [Tamaricihabitans halophyticus]TCP56830.1 beta-lactamase class A [Tamaricihabitans halophyticus]